MAYDDALFQLGMDLTRQEGEVKLATQHWAASKMHHKSTAAPSLGVRATRYSFPAPPQEGVEQVPKKQRGLNRRAA